MELPINFKEVIDFQKKCFNETFDAIVMVQDQAERTLNPFLLTNAMLPKEGLQISETFSKALKTGRDNLKKAVNSNFDAAGALCSFTEQAKSK